MPECKVYRAEYQGVTPGSLSGYKTRCDIPCSQSGNFGVYASLLRPNWGINLKGDRNINVTVSQYLWHRTCMKIESASEF